MIKSKRASVKEKRHFDKNLCTSIYFRVNDIVTRSYVGSATTGQIAYQ